MVKRFEMADTFHHIAIYTSKYNESIKFYEALGFVKYIDWIEDGNPCCFLNMHNGPFLEFHGIESEQLADSGMHICIHTDDVDGFYACAIENGAKPWKCPPGNYPLQCTNGRTIDARLAFIKAPGGEIVEIISWKNYMAEDFQNFYAANKKE